MYSFRGRGRGRGRVYYHNNTYLIFTVSEPVIIIDILMYGYAT